jgi:hypothetical protein
MYKNSYENNKLQMACALEGKIPVIVFYYICNWNLSFSYEFSEEKKKCMLNFLRQFIPPYMHYGGALFQIF